MMHFSLAQKNTGVIFLLIALNGCGGGGGGSDDSISYTGNTNAAVVTNTNGKEMTARAYNGGALANMVSSFANSVTEPAAAADIAAPRTLVLYRTIAGLFGRMDLARAEGPNTSHILHTDKQTIPSPDACGGALTPTGNVALEYKYDDVTGELSGNGSFNSYCESGTVLTGAMFISGHVDTITQQFTSLTVSLNNITSVSTADDFTMKGGVTITHGISDIVNMDLLLRDNKTQKTAWVKDFVMTVGASDAYQDVTLSGRFYDHDEGYIDLSTSLPLRTNIGDRRPSSGRLVVLGANNSKATLTALSSTTYQVDIDENGDGVSDKTETGSW